MPSKVCELQLHQELSEKTRRAVEWSTCARVPSLADGSQHPLAVRDQAAPAVSAEQNRANARVGTADQAASKIGAAKNDVAARLYTRPAFKDEMRRSCPKAVFTAPAA